MRLLHGDFAAETRYPVDAASLLAKYRDDGADWLHIVDLDGARDGSLDNRPIIIALAQQAAIKLQVGGGLAAMPMHSRKCWMQESNAPSLAARPYPK